MSRNGTAFARSRSSMAKTCTSRAAAASRFIATSPSSTFPEGQYILDGELVILDSDGKEEFDALQNRIHPAESRINRLAEETPAIFRAFDLLAIGKKNATKFTLRRAPRGARGAGRRLGFARLGRAHAAHHRSRRGGAVAPGR